jgi:hypothetical protein
LLRKHRKEEEQMKTLCRLIAGMAVAGLLAGCDSKTASSDASKGKHAETAVQPGAATPMSQVNQSMAANQAVEQAASSADTGAGRRAMESIDKINAQKKSNE